MLSFPRTSGILLALAALLFASLAAAQVQDTAQQKCINGLNKSGVKVALAQAKAGQSCLSAAAKGLQPDAQACFTGDPKVVKAQAGTVATEAKCTTAPSFGKTSAAAINASAASEQIDMVADVF